ncbi:MAG: MFS transporter, partial [Planctomycetaceae bacterium]
MKSPRRTTIQPVRLAIMQVVVLCLIAFASSSAYLTRHCMAVANTQIQEDLEISSGQMGWIIAAYSVGYMVFQVPGGWLGDRFGTRSAFAGISALWSLFTIWTSWATSYVPMLLSRVAFGSAQAGLVPLSAKVIKDWMPPALRGSSSAVVAAAMSIGGVATMWLTARLMVRFENDWRLVFQIYSLVGIAWAIVFFALFRTRPEEHPWLKDENALDFPEGELDEQQARRLRPAGSSHGAQPVGFADREFTVSGGELLTRMMRSPTMWAICMQSVLRAAGYSLLVTWMVYLLEHAYSLDKQSAGTMNMRPLIGVVLGSL